MYFWYSKLEAFVSFRSGRQYLQDIVQYVVILLDPSTCSQGIRNWAEHNSLPFSRALVYLTFAKVAECTPHHWYLIVSLYQCNRLQGASRAWLSTDAQSSQGSEELHRETRYHE